MTPQALQGQTALVIGASASIGLASARALAADGAAVVITGRRRSGLAKAPAAIREEFPQAGIEPFAGDATREAALCEALALAHGLAGRLDIIVSAVGGAFMKPLLMRDADSVRQELEVNFMSGFLAVRHGAPLMSGG